MPYTVHDPRAFFAAIVARITTSTGKQVELAIAPDSPVYPYAVVYPLTDESSEGALNDPTQIVVWAWQVTCVSDGAAGAQWMQHKVRQALHGHIPVVAGVGTTPIELSFGSGITRDTGGSDDVSPPLFYSTDRFIAYTSI
jgi:hypothetical protein